MWHWKLDTSRLVAGNQRLHTAVSKSVDIGSPLVQHELQFAIDKLIIFLFKVIFSCSERTIAVGARSLSERSFRSVVNYVLKQTMTPEKLV